ncbi:MAG: ABC transporter ATP-binding protein [Clostridiales bacterium]|nr:ABC transporter ATP-binding protein [Clostridiales bacterium]
MSDIAINVNNVSKLYKLYDKPSDRLKEALGFTREKKYREHYALHNVSFRVNRGETVGIIGTNGSGKSTILKIITGVLNPTEGEVDIEGRISALLELGAGFNMEYTGLENVYLNGTMIGFSREEIDAKLQDILDFADIGDFINQPVKTYSSGMFVRLAFAVAINIDPEILIVDEALSVGDVFFQAKCYHKFEEFKKMGRTILFVSHDLGSVAHYCDWVVLLNQGVKIAEGDPQEMIDLYKKIMVNEDGSQILSLEDIVKHDTEDTAKADKVVPLNSANAEEDSDVPWKSHYQINPNLNEYGSHAADIVDFAILDENGTYTNTIVKGTRFRIRSKVLFHRDIEEPIFTYTLKTLKGTDITGTNTMYEKKFVELARAGEIYVATFEQEMNLQGGEYLLSISCTGYVDGKLTAYDRLYDVVNITVISDKNTVGFYDMNSEVTVEKVSG